MIRVAIPGGRVSLEQWLALDEIAEHQADGTIRLTTRQAVQYHGVLKGDLRTLATSLDEHLMTSFGACGDVVRNVVMCPGLQVEPVGSRLAGLTDHLARTFKPRTLAHWEIFVDGDKAASREQVAEHAFYGSTYLPRKFKIAIAHPGDNSVDVFAQDLGLVPGTHPERGDGFTVLVGGGLGWLRRTRHLPPVGRSAGVRHRRRGRRGHRGGAGDLPGPRRPHGPAPGPHEVPRGRPRLRRLPRRGHGWLGASAALPLLPEIDTDDHLGWRLLADGTHQVGIRVGAGRVRDEKPDYGLRTALREIAASTEVTFLITPGQDVLVAGLAEADRERVAGILADNGVRGIDGPAPSSAARWPARRCPPAARR